MISHHYLAQLCALVYDLDANHVLSVKETDALLVATEHCTCVAFRGTEFSKSIFRGNFTLAGLSNGWDVVTDLRFIPTDRGHGWVHRGMDQGAAQWVRKFARKIDKARPVFLTGHSLGAGLVPHVALRLVEQGFDVRELVTFGEPATLFGERAVQAVADAVAKRTSYLNHGDWIRHTPPFGSTCAPRTPVQARKRGHAIDHYVEALRG